MKKLGLFGMIALLGLAFAGCTQPNSRYVVVWNAGTREMVYGHDANGQKVLNPLTGPNNSCTWTTTDFARVTGMQNVMYFCFDSTKTEDILKG